MAGPEVTVVETGVANVASVRALFERVGARVTFASKARQVDDAAAVVLPGVGSFAAGMESLERLGVTDALRARIERGDRTLCICLGMQLLADSSAEAANTRGLSSASGARVERLDAAPRLPHFGWNEVAAAAPCAIPPGAYYFAHTFAYRDPAPLVRGGFDVATCEEGETFVAGFSRGGLIACQFHPELSGEAGARLARGWLLGAPAEPLANGAV